MDRTPELLRRTAELAIDYLAGVDERPVGIPAQPAEVRRPLDVELTEGGEDPLAVVESFAAAAEPGLVATAGPRYFGFVIGGSEPAAVAADWLTSAWDQNAGLFVSSPAAAAVEDVVEGWIVDLLGLPAGTAVGFTTGATMANFTALAAARSEVLRRAGWDVEAHGLIGAPAIRIVVGGEVHATVPYALRLLGLGSETAIRVPADDQGRMPPDALREVLIGGPSGNGAAPSPTIVCAQAGNVNTGAFDPLEPIVAACREVGAWLHVDGAFGIWAAVSPALRGGLAGLEGADSWTTDAHKWLNVPYDCGIVAVRDRLVLRRSMALSAAYLLRNEADGRDPYDYVPDASRRARAFTVYAALRALGPDGLRELIERCSSHARRFADELGREPGVQILNDVVLNQVLVRFTHRGDETAGGDDTAAGDARTRAVIAAVQRDGTCWVGGTTWHGVGAMRISVSNWRTTEADVGRSVEAILRCAREAGREPALAGPSPRV
ncbi:MAG TPA: pyridoxal-dependent decarboxylase [Candidatus Limnocylindrales bacterium]